jgi:uncharacterized membrane protein YadS
VTSEPNVQGSSEKAAPSEPRGLSEDWTAVCLGVLVVLIGMAVAWTQRPETFAWKEKAVAEGTTWKHPAQAYVGKVGKWKEDPRQAVWHDGFEASSPGKSRPESKSESKSKSESESAATAPKPKALWLGILGSAGVLLILGVAAKALRGGSVGSFVSAFPPLFLLATLAFMMGSQKDVSAWGLEYVLWALVLGLLISNTVGTPRWIRPAVMGEQYIKIGLVLFGAEVLLGTLLKYGVPGVFVAWVVTPIVLIMTYIFGQKILRVPSKTLNMVISADMSVCGVSAAIATAAACRAKRDELSLAIGLSMAFTIVMMVVLPKVCLALNLPPAVSGAWIGGTIDATGAVAAAGAMIGSEGESVAITIKMIQNTLIGVVAFAVATYWVTVVQPQETQDESGDGQDRVTANRKIGLQEIWIRFPKFVLGFMGVSLFVSWLVASGDYERMWVETLQSGLTKTLRGWLFCLAFVCIGLESNFKTFLPHLRSGKPLVLYVVGQSLNLVLTLAMAYLMFGILFPEVTAR